MLRDTRIQLNTLPAFRLCVILIFLTSACSGLSDSLTLEPHVPLKLLVGPVSLQAAITESKQIHSFEVAPSPESDPTLLAQLVNETETKAQRLLTEHLARHNGFSVLPFSETRRLQADLGSDKTTWNEEQLVALGRLADVDMVIDAHILDYGVVRWQYWVTGWLTHASIATTIVGLVSAWNPAAIGAYLAFDATTDLPIWWGGAQIFGWAFRPVRIQLHAFQVRPCGGIIWTEQEMVVKVPGKELEAYPPEDQRRKEVQLEANLTKALATFAESAGEKLTRRLCTENGQPESISNFSVWSVLDLLY